MERDAFIWHITINVHGVLGCHIYGFPIELGYFWTATVIFIDFFFPVVENFVLTEMCDQNCALWVLLGRGFIMITTTVYIDFKAEIVYNTQQWL